MVLWTNAFCRKLFGISIFQFSSSDCSLLTRSFIGDSLISSSSLIIIFSSILFFWAGFCIFGIAVVNADLKFLPGWSKNVVKQKRLPKVTVNINYVSTNLWNVLSELKLLEFCSLSLRIEKEDDQDWILTESSLWYLCSGFYCNAGLKLPSVAAPGINEMVS